MTHLIAKIRGALFRLRCRLFMRNVSIGPGLRIYKKLSITGTGRVVIGRDCLIAGIPGDSSQYVCIETRSPGASIEIGDNASFYAARIVARFGIAIGDGVLIEEAGVVDTDFHSIERNRTDPAERAEKCRIVIGDRAAIGARSFVMKGIEIGADAVIAPGSIVTAPVRPGAIVCGNPAKPIASAS